MRLGAFWGITAPMLVLMKGLISMKDYEQCVAVLNVPGNTVFLEDFRKELWYLHKYVEEFDFSYQSKFENDFALLKGCMLQNGTFIKGSSESSDVSEEEGLLLAYDKLVTDIGVKLVKDFNENKFKYSPQKLSVDTWNAQNKLLSAVKDFCAKNEVSLDNSKSAIIKILKQFKLDANEDPFDESSIDALIEQLHLVRKIPDKIEFDGKVTILSEGAKSYLQILLSSGDFIEQCIEYISITEQKAIPMFGTTFQVYMRRKPSSLYYAIVKKFDYAKSSNAAYLRTVIAECRRDLSLLQQCIKDYVIEDGTMIEVLSKEEYEEIVSSYSQEKLDYFNSLVDCEVLRIEDLSKNDLKVISALYDLVDKLCISGVSSILGVELSAAEFNALTRELCDIGVFGLNTKTFDLFSEFLKSVILVSSLNIQKTSEQLKELHKVVDDVQALFDSLIEIGGDLRV